jgi:hypothetical protein
MDMTIIEVYSRDTTMPVRPARGTEAGDRRLRGADGQRRRPVTARVPARPAGAPLAHRGSGVRMSLAPHRRPGRRVITPVTTVMLALLAALITVWLGLVAQFGEMVHGASEPVPDRLAVVQVQTGETLQQVAGRVAPDAPVGQVVARIKELNELDSAALDAGQTLIAPIG